MGRKSPTAAIYKITHRRTGLIYIGETSNYYERMLYYKTICNRDPKYANSPVYRAILHDGWENFAHETLLTDKEEPRLKDTTYRRKLESAFIIANRANDPKYGYNSIEDFSYSIHKTRTKRGTPCKASTKVLKSDTIFVYDMNTDFVAIYFGKKSFADDIGKDRSIVARCAKNGKATSHYLIFSADAEKRYQVADAVLDRRVNGVDFNGRGKKSLINYVKGLKTVEACVRETGFDPINLQELLNRYNLE